MTRPLEILPCARCGGRASIFIEVTNLGLVVDDAPVTTQAWFCDQHAAEAAVVLVESAKEAAKPGSFLGGVLRDELAGT